MALVLVLVVVSLPIEGGSSSVLVMVSLPNPSVVANCWPKHLGQGRARVQTDTWLKGAVYAATLNATLALCIWSEACHIIGTCSSLAQLCSKLNVTGAYNDNG